MIEGKMTYMKLKYLLLNILVLGIVVSVVGCGKPGANSDASGQSNSATSGGAATSNVISAVQAKLKEDKDLAEIKVSEQNGSIQIDGTVNDGATKDKAEKIVADVQKGLKDTKGLLNNLQIKEAAPAK